MARITAFLQAKPDSLDDVESVLCSKDGWKETESEAMSSSTKATGQKWAQKGSSMYDLAKVQGRNVPCHHRFVTHGLV
eukprot:696207-Amphidinium_carterae.1